MIKTCEHCGKEFEAKNDQAKYCDGPHYRPCPVCGVPVEMTRPKDFSVAPKCCSNECKTKLRKSNLKEKKCAYCGEMFTPKSGNATLCDRKHYAVCEICGKSFEVSKQDIHHGVSTCSHECEVELTKRHNVEKYGVEHPMQLEDVKEKQKSTMVDRYGVEHALQSDELKNRAIESNRERFGVDWALSNSAVKDKAYTTMEERYGGKTTMESPVLKERAQRTNFERYGSKSPFSSEEVKAKIRETSMLIYGAPNPMSCPSIASKSKKTRIDRYGSYWADEIIEKSKQTYLRKYGVDNPSKSQEVMDKIKKTLMERYGVETPSVFSNPAKRISKTNIQFHDLLEHNKINSEYEFHLNGKFYDFYVPSSKTLIEIDPTYTHNSFGNHWNENGLDKRYHVEKTNTAIDAGYRCIHVFDWDDREKIINLLTEKKTVHARKLKIWRINKDTAKAFLEENHLQGSCRGQLLCLGLVDETDNTLYQLMTFGRSRYNKKYTYELLRLCTKTGYRVIGGASKLFSFAVNEYELDSIISYCDKSKFLGSVYEAIGMELSHETDPQKIWSQGTRKITANLLRKTGFNKLFGTEFEDEISDEELMLVHNWLPVFDCGQRVFVYEAKDRG